MILYLRRQIFFLLGVLLSPIYPVDGEVQCLRGVHFTCLDGYQCIPSEWRCNGYAECKDYSDEVDCGVASCKQNEFQCKGSNVCIPEEWHCDQEQDCSDNTDETVECAALNFPPPCGANLWKCPDWVGACLGVHQLCDTRMDCEVAYLDEGQLCTNPELIKHECDPQCEHCVETVIGPFCYCDEGFSLDVNKTCKDIDECSIYAKCEQNCANSDGSFECTCQENYHENNKSCILNNDIPSYLFVTDLNSIMKLDLQNNDSVEATIAAEGVIAMDVDVYRQRMCWIVYGESEDKLICIQMNDINGGKVAIALPLDLSYINKIAIDWVTGNFYLLDEVMGHINVCSPDGSLCMTVHIEGADQLKGFALDPSHGLMFYSDLGDPDNPATISRARMDGSSNDTMIIVSNHTLAPISLAVDPILGRLYWYDAELERIETVTYDGNDRLVIARGLDHLDSITVFERYIYASRWGPQSAFLRIDRFNLSNMEVEVIKSSSYRPGAIRIYNSASQPINASHPCLAAETCKHICLLSGKMGEDKKCQCQQGYVGEGEECKYHHPTEPFLIFGQGAPGSVHGIPLTIQSDRNQESMIPIVGVDSPRAVDFYAEDQYVYYADTANYKIGRQFLNGTGHEIILHASVSKCEGLAVDWMSKNLYWTDDGLKTISVSRLDGSNRKILIKEGLNHPRDITVDPKEGYIYWTDWIENQYSHKKGKIYQAYANGSNITVLAGLEEEDDELLWPNGLSLDLKNKDLYWCDAYYDKIEKHNLVTGKREVVLSNAHVRELLHPFGLSFYKNTLYWSEYRTKEIYKYVLASVNTSGYHPVRLREGGHMFGLKVYDQELQSEKENNCSPDNGGCEDLCLPVPDGRVCACADDRQRLNETHCEDNPDAVKFSRCDNKTEFQCTNGRCTHLQWKCDSEDDCGDSSDEDPQLCDNRQPTCQPDQILCRNNRCLLKRWVCDGDDDCRDGYFTDETGCQGRVCSADQLRCRNGRCLNLHWKCDGEEDCDDGSDESDCPEAPQENCSEDLFECDNKHCIIQTWKCDLEDDCGDGSDERNCTGYLCNPESQFQCLAVDNCINKTQKCDGVVDCGDASDEDDIMCSVENHCREGFFMCNAYECIHEVFKCDGQESCWNGRDEEGCESIECNPISQFKCESDGKCIPNSWKCDRQADCLDASDETSELCHIKDCGGKLNKYQCADHTLCIPYEQLCDGQETCPSGDDERPLQVEEGAVSLHACNDSCSVSECDGLCQNTPLGPLCYCPPGEVLMANGTSCEPDTKRCNEIGLCGQNCTNFKGGYKCSCYEGYVLRGDRRTCTYNNNVTAYIIFSNRNQLRRLNLETREYNILVFNLRNSIALDFCVENKEIYWTDVADDKIYKGQMDPQSDNAGLRDIRTVVQSGLGSSEGLAVDWIGKNLYWVESFLDQIEVAKLNGTYRKTVVAGQMVNPRAIVLDPREGVMFWTDWDESHPRIERSTMAGFDRKTIFSVENVSGGWPNGLTIDYEENRVYWIDAKSDSIHSCLYDGTHTFLVLRGHRYMQHPFAITVFEDKVYWTDWRTIGVYSANKWTGEDVEIVQNVATHPFGIHVYHPYRQPKADSDNPCDLMKCSHLCLLNGSTSAVCACPHLMMLDDDGLTCKNNDVFFVLARPSMIRGLDLRDGNYNVIPAITSPRVLNASSVDFDSLQKYIYWTDLQHESINRAHINGSEIVTVMDGVSNAYGLTIDWVSRNMYWIIREDGYSSLRVATLNGSYQSQVYNTSSLYHPDHLVLDPAEGWMYWININGSEVVQSTIQRAQMDGMNPQALVTLDVLQQPTGLALDPSDSRLYWIDRYSGNISRCDLDGSNVEVFRSLGNQAKPSAITVYKNKVFWADASGKIKFVLKDNATAGESTLRSNATNVKDVFVYDAELQSGGTNGCSDDNGGCQQLCLPTPNSQRVCACTAGFLLTDSICTAIPSFLLFSTATTIRGISTLPGEVDDLLTPITGHTSVVALDYNYEENAIYWVDSTVRVINKIQRDHTDRQILISKGLGRVEGIAIDWVAGNIYWTDQRTDVIEVSRLDGSYRYIVVHEWLDKPRDVVVSPMHGYIFWSDGGIEPKIERALLDGRNRTKIRNESLTWPSGLALDFANKKLYFCDNFNEGPKLGRMDFDGSNFEIWIDGWGSVKDPFSVAIFEDYVYWTDRGDFSDDGSGTQGNYGAILRISKSFPNVNATVMKRGLDQLNDIMAFSSEGQPVNASVNLCASENGGCEQLCFFMGPQNGSRICGCAHGALGSNGTSCEEFDEYLLYSERNLIKSIIINSEHKGQAPQTIAEEIMNVIGIAPVYSQKGFFFTDIQSGNIQFVKGNRKVEIVSDIGSAEGIAYNHIYQEIYWTSYTYSTISRAKIISLDFDTVYPHREEVVVQLSGKDHPRGIAVDVCRGNIYWTNWNEESPSIMMSAINGSNVHTIITTNIQTPNGVTVDLEASKLFWSDARLDKIERCELDGSHRVVLITAEPVHPFGLVTFGDLIFWTDWVRREIIQANKYTGGSIEILEKNIDQKPMGIAVMAPPYNCSLLPCNQHNGGCDGLCMTDIYSSVICSCEEGQVLLEGVRCVTVAFPDVSPNCLMDEFACKGGGECIHYKRSCDGQQDCADNSDENENYCALRVCRTGFFHCHHSTSRCIPEGWRCDGVSHCPDGEDEENCASQCDAQDFECADGDCVRASFRCDHVQHCRDFSDEKGCDSFDCTDLSADLPGFLAGSTVHNCFNTSICILDSWRCDGSDDCGDGSDEKDCPAVDPSRCPSDYFKCLESGRCIPQDWKCDRANDCGSGDTSDEDNCFKNHTCPASQFLCSSNGLCILHDWICDGDNDCPDGQDEKNCTDLVCTDGQFQCPKSKSCIPMLWRCDNDDDCGENEDEQNCEPTRCIDGEYLCSNGICIAEAWVCDRDNDCGDSSDEPDTCIFAPCSESEFQCDNGRCIPTSWQCDGDIDCHGSTKDEMGCDCVGNFSCGDGECISLDKRCDRVSDCRDNLDEEDCDVDTCDQSLPCSQGCVDAPNGGYRCYCYQGFHVFPENHSLCLLNEGYSTPLVIFSNRHSIRSIDFSGRTEKTLTESLTNAVALDYHWVMKTVYWTDINSTRSTISSAKVGPEGIMQGKHKLIHSDGVKNADGLAVDWIANNLYWTDKRLNTIEVSTLNGYYRKVLIDSDLDEPRAITLNPRVGVMFWTDWGITPYIGKAGMDGANPRRLVTEKLLWPNGITIDYGTDRVFWADAGMDKVEFVEADGTNRHSVLEENSMTPHIFSISIFGEHLFWGDWQNMSIYRSHKYHSSGAPVLLLQTVHRPMDLHIFHELRQPTNFPNPCDLANGGCKALCLLKEGGSRTCACPDNFYLAPDELSCISNCSYDEFVCGDNKCIPFYWECDGHEDCEDGSDESNCEERPFYCTPGEFQCRNSTAASPHCIPPILLCDHDNDCSDGSDERRCYGEHECDYKCKDNKTCIPSRLLCDGINQCPGKDDEIKCPFYVTCRTDQFNCRDRGQIQCIPLSHKCDGEPDCRSGEDELDCAVCPDGLFRCPKDNKCIPARWKCDGEADCIDGYDELLDTCKDHTCLTNTFKCDSNQCINMDWVCDGDTDCADSSDESNCTAISCDSEEFFTCDSGECLSLDFLCNGEENCNDGSDEFDIKCPDFSCQVDEFRCTRSFHCIPNDWICDGDSDCSNGEDESAGCNMTCKPWEFHCQRSGHCIPRSFLCDGDNDCQDETQEDEKQCENISCGQYWQCDDYTCLNPDLKCDGIPQCPDGSDEKDIYCSVDAIQCGRNEFKCRNGNCIPHDLYCNHFNDCGDLSDENCKTQKLDCQTNNPCRPPLMCFHEDGKVWCSCQDGYKSSSDNRHCEEINECEQFGTCTQFCNNTAGSFKCWCDKRDYYPVYYHYKGHDDQRCRAKGLEHVLFIADDAQLQRFPPTPRRYSSLASSNILSLWLARQSYRSEIILPEEHRIDSFDILYSTNKAYIVDNHQKRIGVIQLTKQSRWVYSSLPRTLSTREAPRRYQNLTIPFLNDPQCIAVDWVTRHIYWTDGDSGHIGMADETGGNGLIVASGFSGPFAIVVHPKRGYLFITTRLKGAGIWNVSMDGSTTRRLDIQHLRWPSGLAIDYVQERLYWADPKALVLGSYSLLNKTHNIIRHFSRESVIGRPFSIDVFEDWIYASTFRTNNIVRVNKFNHTETKFKGEYAKLVGPLSRVSSVVVTHSFKQDSALFNPCSKVTCSDKQVCVLSAGRNDLASSSCRCILGYELKGGTCILSIPEECRNMNCNNGICVVVGKKPVCICDGGFFGKECDTQCSCVNDGTCTADGSCHCSPRYSGSKCEIDRCNNYCHNGGSCIEGRDGISCKCKGAQFAGPFCNITGPCKEDPCQHGATCVNDRTSYNCICPPSFHGKNCQLSNCFQYCKNNATCEMQGENRICKCSSYRFTGEKCEIDGCLPNNCIANETCTVDINGKVICLKPGSTDSSSSGKNGVPLLLIIAVLVILLVLIVVLFAMHRRRRRFQQFRPQRMQFDVDEDDGMESVKITNPSFKYSKQINEDIDDDDEFESPFRQENGKPKSKPKSKKNRTVKGNGFNESLDRLYEEEDDDLFDGDESTAILK